MRPRLYLALAASSLSLGAFGAPSSVAAMAEDGTARAAEYLVKAEGELARNRTERAVRFAERAVEAAPLNLEARQLLARTYLSDGRLSSAEAAYRDVLALSPGDAAATLNLALVRAALGDGEEARALLSSAAGLSVADRGLGLVLAGDVGSGGALLEEAARAPDADGRVRQNLAFAYAVGGDWQRARTVASQDLAPAAVHQRIGEWARIASPRNSWDQVAYLLNISPVEDEGVPARLALRLSPAAPVVAAATPVVADGPSVELAAYAEPDGAPASVALPVVQPLPMPDLAPPAAAPLAVRHASAGRVLPASLVTVTSIAKAEPAPAGRARSTGRFVVQLGAYVTPGAAERGWAKAVGRANLSGAEPLASKVVVNGRQFTRLSAGHFASRSDAVALCGTVRAGGGHCFVRQVKGDDAPRWASRAKGATLASR